MKHIEGVSRKNDRPKAGRLNAWPLVALLVLAWGCSGSHRDEEHVPGWDLNAPIRLNAGISLGTTTRASATGFIPAIAGWEVYESASPDYTTAPSWKTSSKNEIPVEATLEAVTLSDQAYYAANRKIYTHVRGWYPAGTLSGGRVSFTETVTDGTQEVLLTDVVRGAKMDPVRQVLVFRRPLSQMKIRVVRSADHPELKIRKIILRDTQLPTGIDLSSHELQYTPAQPVVILDSAEGIEVNKVGSVVGTPVMFRPFTGNKAYIDMTAESASGPAEYPGIEITIDDDTDFVAGKSYLVTITFRSQQTGTDPIGIDATVTGWTSGFGDSIEVD